MPAAVAFTHVGVIDVALGRVLPDRTVIVRGSRITHVGSSAERIPPSDALVIDATDRFLIPGLADMHVHLYSEGDLLTYVANGITTVRNMAGDSSHLGFRRRIDDGTLVGPRIVTAGPVLETDPPTSPENVGLRDAAGVRQEIIRQRVAGFDFLKVYNRMTTAVYDSVTAIASELSVPVAGHVPFDVGLVHALQRRQRSIEHFRGYIQELMPAASPLSADASFRDRSVAWTRIDTIRIAALVQRTMDANTWNCPTLAFTVHEMSPAAEHARLLARAEVRHLSLRGLPDRSAGYLSQFTEADFAATQRGLDNQFRLVRALDAAGAGLLVGTDSWLSGYALADELALLVKAGLSSARVLRMATLDAARFLGDAERSGMVKEGFDADLVLLDANPLTSVENVRRIRAVVRKGRMFSRRELDSLITAQPR